MNTPNYVNLSYGTDERQVFDLYPSPSSQLQPVVIFLHGGGFLFGDKSVLPGRLQLLIDQCHPVGIAVISANYRFIDKHPFPAPMNDGTRLIQTIRHSAAKWNLDPERIAIAGGSAGANISLWNAAKGDQAKPDAEDPIERESSAVSAVIQFDGQISKAPDFYHQIHQQHDMQTHLLQFFGVQSRDELELPAIQKRIQESHTIDMVNENMPPVMTIYNSEFTSVPLPPETSNNIVVHHPIHGYLLKEKMDLLGRSCIFRHPGDPMRENEIQNFLLESFR